MRIAYFASQYRSFRRVADVYRAILSLDHLLVKSPEDADLVIIHGSPLSCGALFRKYPVLQRRYVVGYFVWEATDLPREYIEPLSCVAEIWTASAYCQKIFEKYHPNVFRVPHAIERDTRYTDDDAFFLKEILRFDPETQHFLCIADWNDKRKNVSQLAALFSQHADLGGSRLIVKSSGDKCECRNISANVIDLCATLTESCLNALYSLCDAYISAHHAEGWGLTLSDAILHGLPVIAAGYSGNLEFMSSRNSFLIQCEESTIRSDDAFHFFHAPMKWGYARDADVITAIRDFHDCRTAGTLRGFIWRARDDIRAFSRSAITEVVRNRMDRIQTDRQVKNV